MQIAVIDDSQHVAKASADWHKLSGLASLQFFHEPLGDEAATAKALRDFDIIVPMRERTPFSSSLISALPNLKMIALTGVRARTLDVAACTRQRILVSNTGGDHVTPATAEFAFALILAGARSLTIGDAVMRRGGWHESIPNGFALAGKRLGIVGLGKLGTRVASYARAFDMDIVAWSQNLTIEKAQAAGVTLVSKKELFETSDVITLHLVLSDRTRHVVGAAELAAMKQGSLLVNTSRGPLIERSALLAALTSRRIHVALDVYDEEPLAKDDPLRASGNVTLAPHLGYSTQAVFRQFYSESLENILAFIGGKPIRLLNPEVFSEDKR